MALTRLPRKMWTQAGTQLLFDQRLNRCRSFVRWKLKIPISLQQFHRYCSLLQWEVWILLYEDRFWARYPLLEMWLEERQPCSMKKVQKTFHCCKISLTLTHTPLQSALGVLICNKTEVDSSVTQQNTWFASPRNDKLPGQAQLWQWTILMCHNMTNIWYIKNFACDDAANAYWG